MESLFPIPDSLLTPSTHLWHSFCSFLSRDGCHKFRNWRRDGSRAGIEWSPWRNWVIAPGWCVWDGCGDWGFGAGLGERVDSDRNAGAQWKFNLGKFNLGGGRRSFKFPRELAADDRDPQQLG